MSISETAAQAKSAEPLFLKAADARRMEAAEEHGALHHAHFLHQYDAKSRSAWEAFGGGHLVFVAKGSPIGRAHGLGFAGKVSTDDIEHVEDFYFQHQSAAQVDVCPYADTSLFECLNQRGFHVAEFNQTLARRILPQESLGEKLQGIEIRGIRAGESQQWAQLLARTFFADQWQQFEELFRPWAGTDNPLTLAAFSDGRMVAAASGLMVAEHNLAAFFGACTLPEFRGRGIQSAFLQERLKVAKQAGCDLAVTLTMPATTSQRNAERVGFRVAYTKVVCSKPCPPGPHT
jgi:GNAT superfamily N-acetyltransferase